MTDREPRPPVDPERARRRASELHPEEERAGTDDALAQAEAILEDSDLRSTDRDAAPGTHLEKRRSEDTVEPID